MSKLKTLKDLKEDDAGGYLCDNTRDWDEEIKAEAIKWVKELYNKGHGYITIHEWVAFFNLTEEDLV